MSAKPLSVAVNGLTVRINQPGSLTEVDSEGEVNDAPFSNWFYDAAAQRLIGKAFP